MISEKANGVKENEKEFNEEDPLKEENVKNKKTLSENLNSFRKNITLEPFVFLLVTSNILTMLTSANLNLEKSCRVNLNFTVEICDALKNRNTEGLEFYEREVQKLTASAMAWKSTLTALVPAMAALFIGSWTDRTGRRKMFFLYVPVGLIMVSISNLINTFFFYELSLEVFVFSESFFEAISGSWCVGMLVAFSYITAITNEDERTFRIGLLNFWFTAGFPIGMALSGPLVKHFGYFFCYGLSGTLHFINFWYTFFMLEDVEKTEEQKKHEGKGWKHLSSLFFDLTNIKDTFTVVNRDLPRISLLLITASICFGTLLGETSITYLLTRYRYNWDEVKFGLFQAYNFVTHTVGVIISITIFSKYLKWHDAILGIISCSSKIMSSFVYCFAYNQNIFYIAPLVEILNGTALIATRSMLSKLVSPSDFGKVNSIFSLTENIMPLLYVPLYTKVYTSTMEWFPGFLFLMTGALMVPVCSIFCWLLYDYRKKLRISKKEELEFHNISLQDHNIRFIH